MQQVSVEISAKVSLSMYFNKSRNKDKFFNAGIAFMNIVYEGTGVMNLKLKASWSNM